MARAETFQGYARPDGSVGIRNHLAILPSVICSSTVGQRITELVPGAVTTIHQYGCGQLGPDADLFVRTMVGTGSNPNVGAAIVVGLGCETAEAPLIAEGIAKTGKPVELIVIQEAGGSIRTIQEGAQMAQKLQAKLSTMQREEFPLSELVLATECGGSDTTSGLSSNPVVGVVSDMLVEAGGTVMISEAAEFIGAEHIFAQRAREPEIGEQLLAVVRKAEEDALNMGVDIRGANPAPGNIQGGLTTIEEKSLGCIYKGGTTVLEEVIGYADYPSKKGLVVMDTPGYDSESVTGMIAGGAQICIFTTGRGSPLGNPVAPVIKVCANPQTVEKMQDNIDFSGVPVLDGTASIRELGEQLFDLTLDTVNGLLTATEILGHREFAPHRIGPTM